MHQLIFHLLNGKLFSPTKKATYNDINFGIASFMTCLETVIFSLIFHWSYSAGEYKEDGRLNRYGTGPVTRVKTMEAILNALNVSDIISGSVLAFKLLFMKVQSRYGGSAPLRSYDNQQVHLEPMSDRTHIRGYAQAQQEDYDTEYQPPPYPPAARAPSPGPKPYASEHELESEPMVKPRPMV